jgi:osmotically-inducible protein OsmY
MEHLMDDKNLQRTVLDQLAFDPSVDAAHIGVTARDGVVTLTGYVGSYAEKIGAERIVSSVRGVRGIAQEIQVRLPSDKKNSDEEIARRILDILAWDSALALARIKIKVEHGFVTLSGTVEWQYQKQAAADDVRRITGVVGVDNQIEVETTVERGGIREKIQQAFQRSAAIEASRVTVDVSGGNVTLGGYVRAWFERGVAEKAAWSIPGVIKVDDKIVVRP